MKHAWETTSAGDVDTFAHDVEVFDGCHNGPRCTACWFFFCEHCYPDGWDRECPGPPPAGYTYDWSGNGTGIPPDEPDIDRAAGSPRPSAIGCC